MKKPLAMASHCVFPHMMLSISVQCEGQAWKPVGIMGGDGKSSANTPSFCMKQPPWGGWGGCCVNQSKLMLNIDKSLVPLGIQFEVLESSPQQKLAQLKAICFLTCFYQKQPLSGEEVTTLSCCQSLKSAMGSCKRDTQKNGDFQWRDRWGGKLWGKQCVWKRKRLQGSGDKWGPPAVDVEEVLHKKINQNLNFKFNLGLSLSKKYQELFSYCITKS